MTYTIGKIYFPLGENHKSIYVLVRPCMNSWGFFLHPDGSINNDASHYSSIREAIGVLKKHFRAKKLLQTHNSCIEFKIRPKHDLNHK